MKISQVFPSKYVTAADLNGRPYTLTIKTVTLEDMVTHENKKVQKPVCWFFEAQKGFVMNVTNAHIIVALYGDSTEAWEGKRITIYPTKVKAFGSYQDAIRVREEIPAQPKPAAQAAQVEEQSGLDDDADIADFNGDDLDITIDPETGEIIDGDALFAPTEPSKGKQPDSVSQAQLARLAILAADVYGSQAKEQEPELVQAVSKGAVSRYKDLVQKEAQVLIATLEKKLKDRLSEQEPA